MCRPDRPWPRQPCASEPVRRAFRSLWLIPPTAVYGRLAVWRDRRRRLPQAPCRVALVHKCPLWVRLVEVSYVGVMSGRTPNIRRFRTRPVCLNPKNPPVGKPEQCADLVAFLASERASHIAGTVVDDRRRGGALQRGSVEPAIRCAARRALDGSRVRRCKDLIRRKRMSVVSPSTKR